MISIDKPKLTDIDGIRDLMSFWTEKYEVDKYIERVRNEIMGTVEYNLRFWVAKESKQTVGIVGLCDPLPKIISFAVSDKPGEIKILYLDNNYRGKGIGRQLVGFIQNEALAQEPVRAAPLCSSRPRAKAFRTRTIIPQDAIGD